MKICPSKNCEVDQTWCNVEINFHDAIDFQYLTIAKRQKITYSEFAIEQAYKDVCLILDETDELCTNHGYGFDVKSNSPPYEIDFILPKTKVRKVQLNFRQLEPLNENGNYRAMIADLKIHYTNVYPSGLSSWTAWSDCVVSNVQFIKQRTRICIDTNADCSGTLSEEEPCIFNIWHGETDMADVSVGSTMPQGGVENWVSDMMFDTETEAPPSSYGGGNDARTVWVRQIFKSSISSFYSRCLPLKSVRYLSDFLH